MTAKYVPSGSSEMAVAVAWRAARIFVGGSFIDPLVSTRNTIALSAVVAAACSPLASTVTTAWTSVASAARYSFWYVEAENVMECPSPPGRAGRHRVHDRAGAASRRRRP